MFDQSRVLYNSKHFDQKELSKGVYAAVASESGYAVSNAGIIDLGEETLVFDSFLNQQAAIDLQKATKELTGREVDYLVNSHYHNDHIRGNPVFNRSKIFSSTKTRELLATSGIEELKDDVQNAPKALHDFEEYADKSDKDYVSRLNYYRSIVDSLPTAQLILPNATFETKMTFHGSKRSAELFALRGHTKSDSVLYLPEDRIAFLGDLLFVSFHPYLADGNPEELLISLAKVKSWNIEYAVPGHGALGTLRDFDLLKEYVTQLEQIAKELKESGKTSKKELDQVAIPAAFRSWAFSRFFQANLKFLIERVKP